MGLSKQARVGLPFFVFHAIARVRPRIQMIKSIGRTRSMDVTDLIEGVLRTFVSNIAPIMPTCTPIGTIFQEALFKGKGGIW